MKMIKLVGNLSVAEASTTAAMAATEAASGPLRWYHALRELNGLHELVITNTRSISDFQLRFCQPTSSSSQPTA